MSINFKKGRMVAYIDGGKFDNELLYIDDKRKSYDNSSDEDSSDDSSEYESSSSENSNEDNMYVGKEFKIKKGKMEPIIDPLIRSIDYICGKSGSGKSTFARSLALNYSRMNPKNPIYLFSVLPKDPAFDDLVPKYIKRVPINENLINLDFENDFNNKGSLVIFDDVDTENNKDIAKAISSLKEKIMELGRHKKISMIIISHLINPKRKTGSTNNVQTIMNEMTSLVIFPHGGSRKQQSYCLENYLGYSNKEIKTILNMKSRWIQLSNTYPQYILTERKLMIGLQ
jgi:hypothetical protein